LGPVFEPEEYEVSGILAHRKRGKHTEFLVQWADCSYLQCTWEPESGLAHAQRHLAAYMAKSRQIEVTISDVLLTDPARLGRAENRDGFLSGRLDHSTRQPQSGCQHPAGGSAHAKYDISARAHRLASN